MVLGAKLKNGKRAATRARIRQAHGLQRSKAQAVSTAGCNGFDRLATLEELLFFETLRSNFFSCNQRIDESVVLVLVHRAVQVSFFAALVVAVGQEKILTVESCRVDDGGNGVVKIEVVRARCFSQPRAK